MEKQLLGYNLYYKLFDRLKSNDRTIDLKPGQISTPQIIEPDVVVEAIKKIETVYDDEGNEIDQNEEETNKEIEEIYKAESSEPFFEVLDKKHSIDRTIQILVKPKEQTLRLKIIVDKLHCIWQ